MRTGVLVSGESWSCLNSITTDYGFTAFCGWQAEIYTWVWLKLNQVYLNHAAEIHRSVIYWDKHPKETWSVLWQHWPSCCAVSQDVEWIYSPSKFTVRPAMLNCLLGLKYNAQRLRFREVGCYINAFLHWRGQDLAFSWSNVKIFMMLLNMSLIECLYVVHFDDIVSVFFFGQQWLMTISSWQRWRT